MDYLHKLIELSDEKYAKFQANLTPTLPKELFIGVRVPVLRLFAKDFYKTDECQTFLSTLPHTYYDENMLHGILLAMSKDFEKCILDVDRFLPYVDNWAVCDIMSPKIFAKHKEKLLPKIFEWIKSKHAFTCRFGIEMLMSHFLDKEFKPEYFDAVLNVKSEDYYVKMMVAWFFATSLAKQWKATFPIIKDKKLSEWTHNKTIQKACESYRITAEQKEILTKLKV